MQEYPNNYQNIRRRDEDVGKPVAFGDIELDFQAKEVRNISNNKKVKLTTSEYQILNLFMHATCSGQAIKNSNIEEYLYADLPDDKDIPLGGTVPVLLTRIRKKLSEIESKTSLPYNSGSGMGVVLEYTNNVIQTEK